MLSPTVLCVGSVEIMDSDFAVTTIYVNEVNWAKPSNDDKSLMFPPNILYTEVSSYKLIIEICGTFLWKIYAGRHIDYLFRRSNIRQTFSQLPT
jgi:hypothetical protein